MATTPNLFGTAPPGYKYDISGQMVPDNGGSATGSVNWDNQGNVTSGDPSTIPQTNTYGVNFLGAGSNPISTAGDLGFGSNANNLMYNNTSFQGAQPGMYYGTDNKYHQGSTDLTGSGMVYGSQGDKYIWNPSNPGVDSTGRALNADSNYGSGPGTDPGTTAYTGGMVNGSGSGDLSSQFYGKLKSDGQPADASGLSRDYLSSVAGGLGTDLYGIGQNVFGLDHAGTDSWLTSHGMGAPAPAPAPAPAGAPTPQQSAQNYNPYTSSPTLQPYQKNPYLDDMAANITRQATDTWNRNILPGTRSGAMAAGGFGGSRQGVVESNALNDLGNNVAGQLSNLYGNDYQQSQNRNLQQYGMDQGYNLGLGNLALGTKNAQNSYDLGLRSNDLGYANLDANIAQNNFGNNLAGANFGLSALDRLLGYNNNATTTAGNAQNQALTYQQLISQLANQAGGQGGTTTGTNTQPGNLLAGLLGGGILGSNLSKYF